jgi:hypothetical protein
VVRRCIVPTAGGGFAAKRATACDDNSSTVLEEVPNKSEELPLTCCKPSMTSRSFRTTPRFSSSRSSLMDVIGSGHCCGALLKKMESGTERTADSRVGRTATRLQNRYSNRAFRVVAKGVIVRVASLVAPLSQLA